MEKYPLLILSIFLISSQKANAYVIKHSGGFGMGDILQLAGIGLLIGIVIYFIGTTFKIKIIEDFGTWILKSVGGTITIFIVLLLLGAILSMFK